MTETVTPRWWWRWRNRPAAALGVPSERKIEIYIRLSEAATLKDLNYWLQILFAAGLATLGLALNSPAVIIGAMLISPLMGPILSAGLALAAGDVILGLRALANLALSCLIAVGFSFLLVTLLPFKEVTGEIATRTQPHTLDLLVALLSGGIGSIATCKKVEGVMTSIPGVAIAVALMPPLCVVGYGIGLAMSLDPAEGLRVASGGGLLFLTNLVAITFTAMLVFIALYLDAEEVREHVRKWRLGDGESAVLENLLAHLPFFRRAPAMGTVPGRILIVVIPLLVMLVPLSQSLSQLQDEIRMRQQDNHVRRIVTELWQQHFAKLPNGEPRSYIDQLGISRQGDRLALALRLFTNQSATIREKNEWTRLVTARLGRSIDSTHFQLIEIPTGLAQKRAGAREEKPVDLFTPVPQLRASFWQGVETALAGLKLPPMAQFVDCSVAVTGNIPMQVVISYLSDRDIDGDARLLIADDVRVRLGDSTTLLALRRIPATFGPISFAPNRVKVPAVGVGLIENAAEALREHPTLRAEIITERGKGDRDTVADERARMTIDLLRSRWQIAGNRLSAAAGSNSTGTVTLRLRIAQQ